MDVNGSAQCHETAIAAATDPIDVSIHSYTGSWNLTQGLELFVAACTHVYRLSLSIINHQSSSSSSSYATAVAAVVILNLFHRCDRCDRFDNNQYQSMPDRYRSILLTQPTSKTSSQA
jgi:hypothetical protein